MSTQLRIEWRHVAAAAVLLISVAVACGSDDSTPTAVPSPAASSGLAVTLGDIDPLDPAKKVRRFQPSADYLADNLKEFGISEGRVVIASSIEDMGRLMK